MLRPLAVLSAAAALLVLGRVLGQERRLGRHVRRGGAGHRHRCVDRCVDRGEHHARGECVLRRPG